MRVHTDSPRREPGCQPSEPGSTPPAAIWYRVRRFHPFPVWEALEGLCVPVGVVSTPGLSHKSLDFPVSQGVSSDGAPLFRSKWNRSAGGPIFRPFGTQSLSTCRAQRPCTFVYGSLGPKTDIRPVGPFGNARKLGFQAIFPGAGALLRPQLRPAAASEPLSHPARGDCPGPRDSRRTSAAHFLALTPRPSSRMECDVRATSEAPVRGGRCRNGFLYAL